MPQEIQLDSIGSIKCEEERFYLSIKKKYRKALKGIEGFSHINIIWWGNQSDSPAERDTVTARKPYKKGPDTVGIFATRSETRPNPVLLTTAAVIGVDREKGMVELGWIDAAGGSPVIDVKPYQPCSDRVKDSKVPDWCSDWPTWLEDSAAFDWESVFNC
jgi:tRNA-Thr(GGU) m(6)t(6)A37 methyltransferase TsaA